MSETNSLQDNIHDVAGIIARLSLQQMKALMDETGLTHTQLMSMTRMYFHGNCGISEIGGHLGVTDAAASQLVERLVGMGLAERIESPTDRRMKQINLSARGKTLVETSINNRRKLIEDLLNALPPEKRSVIVEAVQILAESAREYEKNQAQQVQKH